MVLSQVALWKILFYYLQYFSVPTIIQLQIVLTVFLLKH